MKTETKTAPAPGAMRAAREINEQWRKFVAEKYGETPSRGPSNTDRLTAEAIDRETHAPAMLAALKEAVRLLCCYAMREDDLKNSTQADAIRRHIANHRALLAQAEGRDS